MEKYLIIGDNTKYLWQRTVRSAGAFRQTECPEFFLDEIQ
jgi:hypothetical protein